MCHLLLILPLVALPVFWILPLSVALPVYGTALGIAGATYWYAVRATRQPRQNGAAALIGDTGQIVTTPLGEVRVCIRSELWVAASKGPLQPGDRVKVIEAKNTTLKVQKLEASC